jgi:hypothetical protein
LAKHYCRLATFKRGHIWRVGDGEKINIWSDPWIPSSPNGKITSRRGNILLTRVNQLIDPNGEWDEGLITSLFNSLDARRIMQIPLDTHGLSDFISWRLTKHGFFSVRTAYHSQWRHQFGPNVALLAMPGNSISNPVWKILWKLRIPGKVKIFVWRALHGILPLKCILANRHIVTIGECPICRQGAEDILQLLFQCDTARELWNGLGLENIITDAMQTDRAGSAFLEHLLCLTENTMPGLDSVTLKKIGTSGGSGVVEHTMRRFLLYSSVDCLF